MKPTIKRITLSKTGPNVVWALCFTIWLGQTPAASANTAISPNAPGVSFYAGIGESCCGEDPHPVHGIGAPDGSFIVGGKALDPQGTSEGFVVKVNPKGLSGNLVLAPGESASYAWAKTFGTAGKNDAINNLAASKSALFAAGFKTGPDGTLDRSLAKLDLKTGAVIWEATFPDPQSGTEGAFEAIQLTSEGGLITTGLINGQKGSAEGFKSYGNPWSGQAFVAYFSPEQLASSAGPSSPQWLQPLKGAVSGKGVREIKGAQPGYVVAAAGEEMPPTVFRLDSEGGVLWSKTFPNHGELTDVAVLLNDSKLEGFAITGHRTNQGGIDGSVTKIAPNGDVLWHQTVGNPVGGVGSFSGLGAGNPKLIFDECWGVQGTGDGGILLGCGTGIEGCGGLSGSLKEECTSDPRQIWRGLVVRLDGQGNILWQRADSFLEPGGTPSDVSDSASEYVSLSPSGHILSVVDQGFGIGVLVLKPDGYPTPGDPGMPEDVVSPEEEQPLEWDEPSMEEPTELESGSSQNGEDEASEEDLGFELGCGASGSSLPLGLAWPILAGIVAWMWIRRRSHA